MGKQSCLHNERGVVAVKMAMWTAVAVGFSAMVIDLGYALVTKNELQNIADASALTAGRELGKTYLAMDTADQQNFMRTLTTDEQQRSLDAAVGIAALATAGNLAGISIDAAAGNAEDVKFGVWDSATRTFTPNLARPTAVQVTARRDGQANGAIATFFAGIWGNTDIGVSATATAALLPGGAMLPAGEAAPFGISEDWFNGQDCVNTNVQFTMHPSGQDVCAGWHQYDEQSGHGNNPQNCANGGGGGGGSGGANTAMLTRVIDCIADGNYTSPPIIPHQTSFNFTNGVTTPTFRALKDLFEQEAANDPNGEWHVTIPIYQSNQSGNCDPSGAQVIVGYATATITSVTIQGNNKRIEARLECFVFEEAAPNPGGGPPAAPPATVPKLVL